MLIDTHSHLFVEEFTEDLPLVMERAQKAGVSYIFMPNIDSTTIDAMLSVCRDYPGFCYPMIGLHPTSVNESYEQELAIVHKYLSTSREFVAIGEIGLDLYWDKTFLKEQILVFENGDRKVAFPIRYIDLEQGKPLSDALFPLFFEDLSADAADRAGHTFHNRRYFRKIRICSGEKTQKGADRVHSQFFITFCALFPYSF